MRGVVFEDLNSDGLRQDGEPALQGMSVSDGVTITKTPADGQFEFTMHENVRGCVFVCTPADWRASTSFFVIADFDRDADKTQPADIGLVRDPARNSEHFRFVQLTDTHVTASSDNLRTMTEDVQLTGTLSDAPAFIVATGDLVNAGKEPEQFKAYIAATRGSRYPLYNVIGNHDYAGQLRATENYERFLGPSYYSFSSGPYHFIAKDSMANRQKDGGEERQAKWIEQDLRLNAVGKRVIVLQHIPPVMAELGYWAERNCAAIFTGHWHGRRERVYKGILDVNTSTTRFGGIDRSPRGFREISVDGEKIRCEFRVGGEHQRLELIEPPSGGQVSGREVRIRAVAYDTAVRVQRMHYRITDAAAASDATPIAEGELWADGAWSWAGRCTLPPAVSAGEKRIFIEATGADGSTWKKDASFTVADAPAVVVKPGEPWPFFHNDAGHRGYLPAGPKPPLAIAWTANIGGIIHISSPVIADGRVYAASSFESSLEDCAVVALDLQTGRRLWRTPVDSSIKHSLATYGGNVLAVSQAGTLYCLDRSGYPRWTASLDRNHDDRWDTSFPVTDGKTVYAGKSSGFGAYDLATGSQMWTQPGGTDWWPSIYAGPSLGASTVYQGGPFVRSLDPQTGNIRWNRTQMAVSTVAIVPAAIEQEGATERLYVFHNRQTLKCLDGANGNTLWSARLTKADGSPGEIVPLGDETGTPAIGSDIVCVGAADTGKSINARPGEIEAASETHTASMYAFDKATGLLRWQFKVGQALAPTLPYRRQCATITSSPVIVGDVVYFGASDGWFYALDARTGEAVWKYWFGLPIDSTVAVSGNTLVLATWDGTIYALAARP
jgi:outer membrane protein assembly factor BamB